MKSRPVKPTEVPVTRVRGEELAFPMLQGFRVRGRRQNMEKPNSITEKTCG